MDWIALAGAVGIGAIVTKLLDVLWVQRIIRKEERRRWLRDQRLAAFSEAAEYLLSLGVATSTSENFFQTRARLSRALLLITDPELAARISGLIFDLEGHRLGLSTSDAATVSAERVNKFLTLLKEADDITDALRSHLLADK